MSICMLYTFAENGSTFCRGIRGLTQKMLAGYTDSASGKSFTKRKGIGVQLH